MVGLERFARARSAHTQTSVSFLVEALSALHVRVLAGAAQQPRGIPRSQLDPKRFKFMTRVHYWAADVNTHGPDSPWGEHEARSPAV